ncbi:MAG: hypothetical protein DRP11_03850, partial [Candidatus Aenigmatarchaeota archaeon]
NSSLISWQALIDRALKRHPASTDGFEQNALWKLSSLKLNPSQRRHLLRRLDHPDVPALVDLIVEDLNDPKSPPFGSLKIHKLLLKEQLDELLQRKPDLLNQTAFVEIYLSKLKPNADLPWESDPALREAYLNRLWNFVKRLPPSRNSLKANVLYHRLLHDRSLGIYNLKLFLTYLRLPRRSPCINRKYLQLPENRRYAADLNADYSRVTDLAPIRNDEPLIRDYLQHFLLERESTEPFDTYLDESYVRECLAETKLLYGRGDPEKWVSLLSPAQYQQLRERVDLDFAPTNKNFFGPKDRVALDLFVKNVRTLIVKIYVINTLNYLRTHLKQVDTSIDLDGLVPNYQRTFTYTEPPIRRVKRHFEFPELEKRGVYVIDFIGSGKSSRAVIRKGLLSCLFRTSAAGQVLTVVDEEGRPLKRADIFLGSQRYRTGKDGSCVIPFSTEPGTKKIVLHYKGFACLADFEHQGESYSLHCAVHIERESLLPGVQSPVIVRPSLRVNGFPVSIKLLKDPVLTITTVDLEGIRAKKELRDLKLEDGKDLEVSFRVPKRLARVTVTLQGKVKSLTQDKEIRLSASASFALRGIDRTEKVEDLHLTRSGEEYILEVRGKGGEAKPDRAVLFTIKHEDFKDPVQVSLKTDKEGRIYLGALEGIAWIKARGPEGTEKRWDLREQNYLYPQVIHATEGESIELPYFGREDLAPKELFSLLEVRSGTYKADYSKALRIKEGFLVLEGLKRGDYELLIRRSGQRIKIRVTKGPVVDLYAVGKLRKLELRGVKPLHIKAIEVEPKELVIRLGNVTSGTRVHVTAVRYFPEYKIFSDLLLQPLPSPWIITVSPPESQYVVGRDIGEEYRYILERRLAEKFPQVMLPRPSLLLNPWPVRSTQMGVRRARPGEAFGRRTGRGTMEATGGVAGRRYGPALPPGVGFSNLDFLKQPAFVLTNLKPDSELKVVVPREKLGSCNLIFVAAVSPLQTVVRSVSLPKAKVSLKDIRLTEPLDPDNHFVEKRKVTVVNKGESFKIENLKTAKYQIYQSLGEVFDLLQTLSGNPTLSEFSFLKNWNALTEKEKRDLYSKYACHELNFFIYKKDKKFFQKVVKPYLKNKFQKTFVDKYLLGEDLSRYLDPWAYERLNVFEKILLSQRIPSERENTIKHLQDLFQLKPRVTSYLEKLFETALRTKALQKKARIALESKAQLKDKRRNYLQEMEIARIQQQDALKEKVRIFGAYMPDVELSETGKDLKLLLQKEIRQRAAVRRLYRAPEKTKEWAENNYWHIPPERDTSGLVKVNA